MTAKKASLYGVFALLLISYFIIPRELFWNKVDHSFFKAINHCLSLGKPVQIFWATLNHKLHDWIVDLVFLSFCFSYIRSNCSKTKSTKLWEIIIIFVIMMFSIFIVNKYFLRYHAHFDAISPSLKYKDYFHINRLLPFLKTKIYSHSSFPGDHATTAFLFFFVTYPLFSKKQRLLLGFYTALIILPRLVVGAHNISDILCGSMTLAALISFIVHRNKLLERLAIKFSNKRPLLDLKKA